jgi:hypothetical protein
VWQRCGADGMNVLQTDLEQNAMTLASAVTPNTLDTPTGGTGSTGAAGP